ncbi:DUF2092 domain-containing protein [Thiocystis violacea]|uniref:DUF2092 domain-containing protein n=1 Tax=Thiocystis violacea TaxID=13725 RepID=UPI0019088B28|nr:DUF2092 domain-containing protein [Thiocystis violacea]MBK1721750.1 hypothetical protein [Thiocystis violacea]
MTLRSHCLTALALAGLVLAGPVPAQEDAAVTAPPEAAVEVAVEPAALDALHRMGAYLRGLGSFTLKAEDRIDEVLENGQKIQLNKTIDIKVRKPDHLRADIVTDRKARVIYYDGKQFTLYAPEGRYYATVDAPPTIRELLTLLTEKYGIEFPLQDLFYWGTDAAADADIQQAMWVGASRIGKQLTDHYAFRQADVDWQIWIAQGDEPLPLRYVITTKDEPGEPQFMADMAWNVKATPNDGVFTFSPAKEDEPIEILSQEPSQATP